MSIENTKEQVSGLIIELWDQDGRKETTPMIEEVCDRWQGTSSLASNLIRCANDRGFSVTIDPETADLAISEPLDKNDQPLVENIAMLTLLFDNFEAIQKDAYAFLITNLEHIEDDDDANLQVGSAA